MATGDRLIRIEGHSGFAAREAARACTQGEAARLQRGRADFLRVEHKAVDAAPQPALSRTRARVHQAHGARGHQAADGGRGAGGQVAEAHPGDEHQEDDRLVICGRRQWRGHRVHRPACEEAPERGQEKPSHQPTISII